MYGRAINLRKAKRIESLARDMAGYAEGKMPSEEALVAAPILLTWRMATREAVCLEGVSSGHPILEDGPIVTSEIWWLTPEWVRTTSRLYRLGTELPEDL